MNKKFLFLLGLIVILAGYVRLTKLDKIPPHLGNDEISIAYDSYSVRLIGKDEHGNLLPLSFQSHRSYKAPLYAYLNIPINYILGNTEYGVRVLSVISGVVCVIMVALIGWRFGGTNVAMIAALLMATDPKSIFASRIGYESNLAMAVLLVGIFFLVQYKLGKHKIWLAAGGFFMGLSVWGYHTEWGLMPMIFGLIIWVSRDEIKIRKWWLGVVIATLVSLPIYYDCVAIQSRDANNRASSQLWFSSGKHKDYLKNSHDNVFKKLATTLVIPIYSYIDHFGLNVNFSSGSELFNERSPLNSGWFLLPTLPMIFFGLANGRKFFGNNFWFLMGWWLLCPIIPAMTGEVSAVRNLVFIAPSVILMAGGGQEIWLRFKKLRVILVIALAISFGIFLAGYFVHYPIGSGDNFQYGYKQALESIKPIANSYDKIVVEDRFGRTGQFSGVPHLYFGYFGAFSVNEMQGRDSTDGLKIGKFQFKYVDWNQEIYQPKTIYIVSAINPKAGSLYDKLVEIGMIRNTNFEPQFLIYKTID